MNAVVPAHQSLATNAPPSKAAKVRESLMRSEIGLLAPLEAPWTPDTMKALCTLVDYGRPSLEKAKKALALDISPELLRIRLRELEKALTSEPERKTIMALVGLLVAAYPSGRPSDLDAYLETLVHEAMSMGFSAPVVAKACQALRRTVKFMPSCAEFVEACGKAKSDLEGSKKHTEFMLEKLERAARVVELGEEIRQ